MCVCVPPAEWDMTLLNSKYSQQIVAVFLNLGLGYTTSED